MRRVLPLVPILLVLPLAGCSKTLDVDNAEKEIAAGFDREVGGAEIREVTCPDEISADIGTKATCTLALKDDVQFKIAVDVTGEDGRIRWRSVSGTLPGKTVETKTADSLAAQVGQRPKGVDCPARVNIEVGSKTRCQLTTDEAVYGVTITITDGTGAFDIKVDDQPTT